jgi:RimJ/RimL family protein N-acetyltransferase
MLAVMTGVGMQQDGIRREEYSWEGRYVDLVHMALFREAWIEKYPDGVCQEDRGGEA